MASNSTFSFTDYAEQPRVTPTPPSQLSDAWLDTDDHVGFSIHICAAGFGSATIFFLLSAPLMPGVWISPVAILACVSGTGWFVYQLLLKDAWTTNNTVPAQFRYVFWLLSFPLQLSILYCLLLFGLPPDKPQPSLSILGKWLGLALGYLAFLYMGQTGFLSIIPSLFLTLIVWLFLMADFRNGEAARLASLLSSDDAREFLRMLEKNQNSVRRRMTRQLYKEEVAKERRRQARENAFRLGSGGDQSGDETMSSPPMSPQQAASPVATMTAQINSPNQTQSNWQMSYNPQSVSVVQMQTMNNNNMSGSTIVPDAVNVSGINQTQSQIQNQTTMGQRTPPLPVLNQYGTNPDGTPRTREQMKEQKRENLEKKREDQLALSRRIEAKVSRKMNAAALDEQDFIKSSAENSFEWMRLILLITWLLYPLAFAWLGEDVDEGAPTVTVGLNSIYNLIDIFSVISYSIAFWAACNSFEQSIKQLDYKVWKLERLACGNYVKELKRRGIMHSKYIGSLLEWLKIDGELTRGNSVFRLLTTNDKDDVQGKSPSGKGSATKASKKRDNIIPEEDSPTISEAESDLAKVQMSAYTLDARK